jgi:hypothetical protein
MIMQQERTEAAERASTQAMPGDAAGRFARAEKELCQ